MRKEISLEKRFKQNAETPKIINPALQLYKKLKGLLPVIINNAKSRIKNILSLVLISMF